MIEMGSKTAAQQGPGPARNLRSTSVSGPTATRLVGLFRATTGREQMQQTAQLFDHLICAGDERGRNGETERFGSLEIDNEFEFGDLLNR
jgi:hypothetical protein